ncbi:MULTISPECIES: Rv2231c family pyridoxal phosphate-dependent protein CobC [unclassified Streptomyces]|uniref:Rv2231c family pyridoxal phosphate-dependent protein CobC n=1 Tax=unclassified Streptomyces TaxID=2593676 RepID=UPI002256C6A3|nr:MULTISPECIES: Rv2231c family pyridoxal phosphate-dependent protein CobC [unclassified Streptomyces]MCX4630567.1 Rv2231c family pyridoxal phosphate-dependent protein CobC [Streptomyces sp. NBC_01443]WSW46492.1 Rv2231c family pyridoxal phosphate-dependent protein CobC [Streptomyces sp. NBC_01001]
MIPVGEYATQLVVGVGGRAGVSVAEVCALVEETLRGAGLAAGAVKALATVESKAGEAGITGAAERFGVPLLSYPAEKLAGICVPHPSDAVRDAAGTSSVAEAAALAGGGELLVPKRRSVAATCAVATAQAHDLRHHGDAEVRGDGGALVDLAVNVRAHTPPEWLKQRIAASLDVLSAYPDGRSARAAVAARHGLPADRVLLTAGAAEAFVLIARALGAQRPVVVHPQFTEPEAALRDAGHTVERVVLRAADGFRLDPAAVPEDADLVVVGNPTNPTSVLHPAAVLIALARPGRILVVDEAFLDAVPGEREALAGRTDVPGLVVLRSLTKTWGLAGLRIGYVLAEPHVIAKLAAAQPLWPVSSPALVAAEACMAPAALAEAEAAARQIAVDRAHLLAGLAEFEEITVSGVAEGPFVLIQVAGAMEVRTRLRALGFAVRRGDTFPGLDHSWLRLAVRDRATTGRLLQALDHALALTAR